LRTQESYTTRHFKGAIFDWCEQHKSLPSLTDGKKREEKTSMTARYVNSLRKKSRTKAHQ